MRNISQLLASLGDDKEYLLDHICEKIPKEQLHEPNPFHIVANFLQSNPNGQTIRSLAQIYNHGRLSGTIYVSILPIDQGIEHRGRSSFAPNLIYFEFENSVKLAIEGGCNAVASTMGGLAMLCRKIGS